MSVNYDRLARDYAIYRKADARISERIQFHIGSARKLLNVGAGMGSYEPDSCEVVAVHQKVPPVPASPLDV